MFKKVHWVHGTWSDIASALLSNELRSHSKSGPGCEVSRRCQHKWNYIITKYIYRTRTIITRGLYSFYPLFEAQKRFFKGLFS